MVTDLNLRYRVKQPYKVRQPALLYIAALAAADPDNRNTLQVKYSASRVLEWCYLEPPLASKLDALSKQGQACLMVLDGITTEINPQIILYHIAVYAMTLHRSSQYCCTFQMFSSADVVYEVPEGAAQLIVDAGNILCPSCGQPFTFNIWYNSRKELALKLVDWIEYVQRRALSTILWAECVEIMKLLVSLLKTINVTAPHICTQLDAWQLFTLPLWLQLALTTAKGWILWLVVRWAAFSTMFLTHRFAALALSRNGVLF